MAAVAALSTAFSTRLIRARAKVLARQDRALQAELIRLRQDAGLTQKQIADRMGVTQQAINKLERYDADPKLSTLRRYANAVGALVEHKVSPDVGQSEWLAVGTRWDALATLPSQRVQTSTILGEVSLSPWGEKKQSDFALAG